MNLETMYWWFDKGVEKTFCDKIIKLGDSKTKQKGTLQDNKLNIETRKSDVVWLDEPWIYEKVWEFVNVANINSKWNFDIDWCEKAQYTVYEKGQYYGWHMDQFAKPYIKSDPNHNGKIRKISLSLQLSNGDDYEGGDLEFCSDNMPGKDREFTSCSDARNKGTLIFFPSFLFHRVKPVTKGIRKSLVVWFIGRPYK
jgi:PKHD-type hydroxylase|tara:strand:- start:43 stop:633 length:591 start_codon:yes stop_codon:yes gene_type:complete